MSYGIHIFGQDGGIILDSDYHLLKFAGKGTNISISLTINFPDKRCYKGYVCSPALSLSSEPTMFFNIASGNNICVDRIWENDATHRIMQFSSFYNAYPDMYWFENEQKTPSEDDYGLLVYDASGNLLFDSGWYKADLLNVVNIRSLVATLGESMSVSAGITKPAIMFQSRYGRARAHDYSGQYYRMAIRRNTTVFSLEEQIVQSVNYGHGTPWESQTWPDGATYSVPIIDGDLYD